MHFLSHPWNKRQQSIIDFWFCISGNKAVSGSLLDIIQTLAAFIQERERHKLPAHPENEH
jgi:hypothetical protein